MRALLKHEWRLTSRFLGVTFGAVILVVLGSSILMWLKVAFFYQVAVSLSVVTLIAFLTGVGIFLIVHYYKTMNGKQGYFTHVLPVRGRTIYLAKMLHAALVSIAALALALSLTYYLSIIDPIQQGHSLPSVWQGLAEAYRAMGPGMFWFLVSAMLLGGVLSIVSYAFCISIGSEGRFTSLGLGGPVLVAVAFYVVEQIVSLISMFVLPLGIKFTNQQCPGGTCSELDSHFVFESMWSTMAPFMFGDAKPENVVLGIGWVPAITIMVVVMIWWTINSIEKHTSLR